MTTPRTTTPGSRQASAIVLALLLGWLVVTRLLLIAFPTPLASRQQESFFSWGAIAVFWGLAAFGAVLARRTGFPGTWDAGVPLPLRTVWPAAVGLGLGLVAATGDAVTGWTRIVAERLQLSSIHVPLPMSLAVYPAGAVISDVLLRLVPLPLVVFLVSGLLLRGRAQAPVFWTSAALLSGVEGLSSAEFARAHPGLAAYMFVEGWLLNVSQAWFFRRAGFFACVVVRVAFYLVWHIAWGGWFARTAPAVGT
jgi:hypothetical protein